MGDINPMSCDQVRVQVQYPCSESENKIRIEACNFSRAKQTCLFNMCQWRIPGYDVIYGALLIMCVIFYDVESKSVIEESHTSFTV